MNGRVISTWSPGPTKICGYTGNNCEGEHTSITGSAGSAHAIIYSGGHVRNIVSFTLSVRLLLIINRYEQNSFRVTTGNC